MENDNEILLPEEDRLPISKELQVTINKKVEEIKQANPKVRVVFPIVVAGADWDAKELYVGYFAQPSFTNFSKYLTASSSANQAVAMRTLAKDCFLDGDKELVDDDSLFMFGLMGQLGEIIKMRNGKIINLSKPGK